MTDRILEIRSRNVEFVTEWRKRKLSRQSRPHSLSFLNVLPIESIPDSVNSVGDITALFGGESFDTTLAVREILVRDHKFTEAFRVANSMEGISRMITTLRQTPGESFTAYKERADSINVYVRQFRNDYADRQLRIFFIDGLLDKNFADFAKPQKVAIYLELAKLLEDAGGS